MTDAPEESELVARAAQGDLAAVEVLLQRHLAALRAYVRLRSGPSLRAKEATCDIVQSVCRDVLGNLERFQYPGESAFRAWLFLTAQRKIADKAEYWGAQKRDVGREVPLDDVYRTLGSPSAEAMGREALERIESAFDELPEDHREVILLSRVVGLPRDEVAARLGRSEAGVRNLLSRALADLAERYDTA
jgi:RNA polymerase sigma-70 factor, ECF subfamily